MIHEQDVLDAIAECQGERNPNANTCIKLAAFLTIQRELFGHGDQPKPEIPQQPEYSYASDPADLTENTVGNYGDTEFARIIEGRPAGDIWPLMDELMSTLQILQPRLYESVMRKLRT